MAESFDVIVVGGGPAGAAAAISSVNRGLSVCLVERDQFPRDRPGETLHPGVQPLLALLGVEAEVLAAGFLRHPGIWVGWNDKPNFQAFGHDVAGFLRHPGIWVGWNDTRRTVAGISGTTSRSRFDFVESSATIGRYYYSALPQNRADRRRAARHGRGRRWVRPVR